MNRRTLLRSMAAFAPVVFAPGARSSVLPWLMQNAGDAEPDNEAYWLRVRDAFDIDHTLINLNNGGVSPAPRQVIQAVKSAMDRSNLAPAYEMWRNQEPRVESVRTGLAAMFGVDAEEVAITRNASESLEIALLGIDMQRGDNIVTTTQDYPRMLTTCEQRVKRDGIELKKVRIQVPIMNDDDFVQQFAHAITPRTKAVLVSHVVFLTGQINPVRKVCDLARERGVLSIVDGAHAFAHFPFTQKDLGCDVFGTSLHKWLCGPIGTGMLYVRKERIPDIWPLMAAAETQSKDIRKFEEIGTHPASIHNAIAEAIEFHNAIGGERKAARLRYLHSIYDKRVMQYGNASFLTNTSKVGNQCGLRLLHIEGIDPNKLSTWLLDKQRIFTVAIVHDEFKGLRVAPSVYTTTAEMERFAVAIEQVAAGKVDGLRT